MVVNILGSQTLAREFLQEIVFFVGGVVRSNDAELASARLHFSEPRGDRLERPGPGNRLEGIARAHHRRLQPLRVRHEIERVAALDAQELAVDAAVIAVIPADDLVVANPQRGAAAVAAMRADGANMFHLPGARLIAIDAAGERAHRANVDAGAALVAFQVVVMVRHDLRGYTAIGD